MTRQTEIRRSLIGIISGCRDEANESRSSV